jgi:hypothetical protein
MPSPRRERALFPHLGQAAAARRRRHYLLFILAELTSCRCDRAAVAATAATATTAADCDEWPSANEIANPSGPDDVPITTAASPEQQVVPKRHETCAQAACMRAGAARR